MYLACGTQDHSVTHQPWTPRADRLPTARSGQGAGAEGLACPLSICPVHSTSLSLYLLLVFFSVFLAVGWVGEESASFSWEGAGVLSGSEGVRKRATEEEKVPTPACLSVGRLGHRFVGGLLAWLPVGASRGSQKEGARKPRRGERALSRNRGRRKSTRDEYKASDPRIPLGRKESDNPKWRESKKTLRGKVGAKRGVGGGGGENTPGEEKILC